MTEAKRAYQSLLRHRVAGLPVWYKSSRGLRRRRPLPCTSRSVQGIRGSLVAYCPILERGGAEVCIGTTAMVAVLTAYMDKN